MKLFWKLSLGLQMTLKLEMFGVWKAAAWPDLGHTIDLTPPLFIEVTMLSQQSERSSIYAKNIYCASLYGFVIWFWPRSDRVVYFVFHLISKFITFYTAYYQHMYFWLELELKNRVSVTLRLYVTSYMSHSKGMLATGNGFSRKYPLHIF